MGKDKASRRQTLQHLCEERRRRPTRLGQMPEAHPGTGRKAREMNHGSHAVIPRTRQLHFV
jgi:hypothetical protein